MYGFGLEIDGSTALRVMQQIVVEKFSTDTCEANWGASFVDGDYCALGSCVSDAASGNIVCADACNGDSGGFLVDASVVPPIVYGVVSRGASNCGHYEFFPGVYTSFADKKSFMLMALTPTSVPKSNPPPMSSIPPSLYEGDAAIVLYQMSHARSAYIMCYIVALLAICI